MRYFMFVLGIFVTTNLFAADIIAVKRERQIVGFNVATRSVAWEVAPCPEINFARVTGQGMLVGCEKSIAVMLSADTGKELWRYNLATDTPGLVDADLKLRKSYDIDQYHGEIPAGYVLGTSNDATFLIGKNGAYLLRCDERCGPKLKSVKLFADRLLIMSWRTTKTNVAVVAFDTSANKLAWEMNSCLKPNFAEQTSVGILVGCDDSNVMLLDPTTGNTLWRRDLAVPALQGSQPFREFKINHFHAETPHGFLVSHGNDVHMLIGKRGEYLMRCDHSGCERAPRAEREERAKSK